MCTRSEFGLKVLIVLALCANPAFAHEIAAVVRDGTGAPLADAVVVAVAEVAPKLSAPMRESIVQETKEFRPFVKAVLVGTPIEFPNRDDVQHHVYSFSPARTFELKAYAGTPADPIVFDKPGVVALGCNIHDWMLAYIYVSESPYFGVTGAEGRVLLAGLPAGRYTVRVWHPRLTESEASTSQAVSVTNNGGVEVAWALKLKRDARIRRAPTGAGSSYR